jgi:hypothetical protein
MPLVSVAKMNSACCHQNRSIRTLLKRHYETIDVVGVPLEHTTGYP